MNALLSLLAAALSSVSTVFTPMDQPLPPPAAGCPGIGGAPAGACLPGCPPATNGCIKPWVVISTNACVKPPVIAPRPPILPPTCFVSTKGSNVPPFSCWRKAATNLLTGMKMADRGFRVVVAPGLYPTGGSAPVKLEHALILHRIAPARRGGCKPHAPGNPSQPGQPGQPDRPGEPEDDEGDLPEPAGYSIAGELNLNPGASDNVEFSVTTPTGEITMDTMAAVGSTFAYDGPATALSLKVKAQGRTLTLNGTAVELDTNERYTITSSAMSVVIRNESAGDKWEQAKGQWWVSVDATAATVTPLPAGAPELAVPEEAGADVAAIPGTASTRVGGVTLPPGLIGPGTPGGGRRSGCDRDGDGMDDAKEFLAGTDASDPRSALEVKCRPAQAKAGDNRTTNPRSRELRWPSVAGKTYRIDAARDLAGGFSVLRSGIAATPPENCIELPETTDSKCFFRVAVE